MFARKCDTMTRRAENSAKRQQQKIEKMRSRALASSKVDLASLPEPLRVEDDKRLVRVFVEGYEDVAFWRCIFDNFTNPYLRFEISVPTREDLPKGKKVLINNADKANHLLLLCMDSDFDYLLSDDNPQSRFITEHPYMFHTYAYATENYLCYAPSLHNVCVKATKNDTRIFSFETFLADYSRTIYPLFLWYVYSASKHTENVFPLADFKASVRLNYLDIPDNGRNTIQWLERQVARREQALEYQYPDIAQEIPRFGEYLKKKGVEPELTYLFMHGHTLMDNVVMILLHDVCEKLRQMSLAKIVASSKEGVALNNEMSNYKNTLRSIRDVLLDNDNYTSCPLYKRLEADIQRYIETTVAALQLQDK